MKVLFENRALRQLRDHRCYDFLGNLTSKVDFNGKTRI